MGPRSGTNGECPAKVAIRAGGHFRPSAIIPEDGIQSRTAAYRWMYAVLKPLLILVRSISQTSVLTTRIIGDAMLGAVRPGMPPRAILRPADIYRLSISHG